MSADMPSSPSQQQQRDLDIDVSCTFYMGEAKVGMGRTPWPVCRRADPTTIEVLDRLTQRLDAVRCTVSDARK